eukprot:9851977-Alexandrium_andersonii.AAC.1
MSPPSSPASLSHVPTLLCPGCVGRWACRATARCRNAGPRPLKAENFGTSHRTALGDPAKLTVLGKAGCIRSAVGTP